MILKEGRMEVWVRIDEFPNYRISNEGRVLNDDTGRILKESLTRTGLVKVGLVLGGVQHTRSVALLVAEQFVDGRSEMFDTPIHLDGDRRNNAHTNLAWRPRWFAWKYARQYVTDTLHSERGPIMDLTTGVEYATFADAAMTHGLLMDDIWKCLVYKKLVFPTNQMFKLLK